MNKGLQTVKKFHDDIYKILPQLKSSMLDLTLKYEQKSLNNINKQFQDCIMNYFFEDIVGDLIKQEFQFHIKTQIKQHFMQQISIEINKKNKSQSNILHQLNKKNQKIFTFKKYMLLPQKYIQEIILQKKEEDYISLLSNIALEKINFQVGEQRWRSQIRKKTFAALLLVHFYNDYPLQSIFEMWDNTFPSQSIKKQKKSELNKKKTSQKPTFNQNQIPQTIQEINKTNFDKNFHLKSNQNVLFTQNSEKKCNAIDINEPNLSKQEQFDHYLGKFPFEQNIYDIDINIANQTENDSFSCSTITNYLNTDSDNVFLQSTSNFDNNDQIQQTQFIDQNHQNCLKKSIDYNQNNSESIKQKYKKAIHYLPKNTLNLNNNPKKIIEENDLHSLSSIQDQNLIKLEEDALPQKQIQLVYSSNNICVASENFLLSNYLQSDSNNNNLTNGSISIRNNSQIY